MIRAILSLLVLLAACANAGGGEVTTTAPAVSSTVPSGTTSTEPPEECPPPPYEFGFLPTGVGDTLLDTSRIEPDVWTSVPGTGALLLGRDDGTVGIALVRGTLPPVDWPAEKGEVFIDGTRGVAGPHSDGTWVAGWYEAPGERCDLYTFVAYPPVTPADVEQVIEGLNRVGG